MDLTVEQLTRATDCLRRAHNLLANDLAYTELAVEILDLRKRVAQMATERGLI